MAIAVKSVTAPTAQPRAVRSPIKRLASPIAISLVVLLGGCAASDGNSTDFDSTSTPTSTPRTVEPSETPADLAESDPCPPIKSANSEVVDRLGGYEIPIPEDRGPNEYANGTFTLDDSGVPQSYIVVEGDTYYGVADRTCIWLTGLAYLNSVRRNSMTLYPGDTLNLNAYTITSVGDENGIVYENIPPALYIPPQH